MSRPPKITLSMADQDKRTPFLGRSTVHLVLWFLPGLVRGGHKSTLHTQQGFLPASAVIFAAPETRVRIPLHDPSELQLQEFA